MYWTINLQEVPTNITLSLAVTVQDRIYSLDCFVSPSKGKKKSSKKLVYVLDTVSYRWSCLFVDLTSSQAPRYDDFTAVVFGQKIFAWGQDARDASQNVLYCMDTVRLTLSRAPQCGRAPGRRVGHEAVVVGREMFVFGGHDEASGERQKEVWALDLLSLRWRLVRPRGEPPDLGATFSVAVIDSMVYLWAEARGAEQSVCWEHVFLFDASYELWTRWQTFGTPPPVTSGVSVFARGGHIYAFGGCWMGSDDIYRFNPRSRRWDFLKADAGGAPARVLFGASCLVVGERVFVLGADDRCGRGCVRVLDFAPSLQSLCVRVIIAHGLDRSRLPRRLRNAVSDMATCKALALPPP